MVSLLVQQKQYCACVDDVSVPFMQVPWGRKELAIGLFSWAISFVAVGIVLVPIIGFAAGVKV